MKAIRFFLWVSGFFAFFVASIFHAFTWQGFLFLAAAFLCLFRGVNVGSL